MCNMALVVIEKAADQEFQMISSLLGFPTFDEPVVYHQGKCIDQALYITQIVLLIYILVGFWLDVLFNLGLVTSGVSAGLDLVLGYC